MTAVLVALGVASVVVPEKVWVYAGALVYRATGWVLRLAPRALRGLGRGLRWAYVHRPSMVVR